MVTKKLQIVDNLVKQAENADTLDGQHASEFASATGLSEVKELVGDLPVSEQINAATKSLVCEQAGNADTVDGKHASEFASATDLSELQGLVGSTSVSEQISAATENLVCETVTANKVVGAVYA